MFVNEGKRWISSVLQKASVKIEPDAIDYIIELTGTNLGDLENQVELILNFIKSGEVLTVERVKNIVSRIHSYTVFDLCNALFIKNKRETLRIFRFLIKNGENPVKIEFFISRTLQKILNIYTLMEKGYDFPYIVKDMKLRRNEAERLSKVYRKVEIERLKCLFSEIAELDYVIKTVPMQIAIFNFERFIMKMGN